MKYLAHSAKKEYPAQSYESHTKNVLHKAMQYAKEAGTYAPKAGEVLCAAVHNSALLHDLGKLDAENQAVLSGVEHAAHLPVNHVDAGTARLLQEDDRYAALNVYAHHRGLPDMADEGCRDESLIFRDDHEEIRKRVDAELGSLLLQHSTMVQEAAVDHAEAYNGNRTVFFRMMMSCLADADHTDTAIHYGQAPVEDNLPELRAPERLAALDAYVSKLSTEDERSRLRKEMYYSCRDSKTRADFSICDSPVGSGKTTAIMAHLLKQAIQRGSRRVFVVLPYTSIITQSVDVYRKSLVLPGEDPEKVVAELHCRADFQDADVRYLTALWRAPIVVTTAVAFFETLASNKPSCLRRLHELPGSLIFVDESHNALPLHLLPLAWKWMNVLSEEWACYWVLASGSLVKFWQLDGFAPLHIHQPVMDSIVETSLRASLMKYEKDRIHFRWNDRSLSREDLKKWVQSLPGPRLLILNTVQSAAVIANDLCESYGRQCVEHLSTALSAEDRDATINRVKMRLSDKNDSNWTLVATSCIEAGVDFSFRTGLREVSSLLSLLQSAGRVNRHGTQKESEMWSFTLQDDSMLKKNPGLESSSEVLLDLFRSEAEISPELCTDALNQEIVRNDSALLKVKALLENEEAMQFKSIAEQFAVIDSNTVTAIVDQSLCSQVQARHGDWRTLQKKTVSIRCEKRNCWCLEEIKPDLFRWTLRYDNFLGYMRGVLDLERAENEFLMF